MISLTNARPGADYTIQWNANRDEEAAETERYGLVPGEKVHLVDSGSAGVILSIGGKRIAVGRETASRIKV